VHLAQTDTDSTHPTTQSDPDLQTAQPQARNSRTITDCRGYQSSRAVCRLGRSGSSGFVGRFRPWNWCGCVPVSRVRSCLNLGVWFCLRRLKNRNRVRAYRTHPTSGLKVSCGLRLAMSELKVT